MNEVRTERRFGVTAELQPMQRLRLAHLIHSEVWPDVLDVMEQCCIEIETDLINTLAENESAVLSNHKMAKAAWKIFTHLQDKIAEEAAIHLESAAPKNPVPELSEREQLIEHILDPTKPPPPDDYMGI